MLMAALVAVVGACGGGGDNDTHIVRDGSIGDAIAAGCTLTGTWTLAEEMTGGTCPADLFESDESTTVNIAAVGDTYVWNHVIDNDTTIVCPGSVNVTACGAEVTCTLEVAGTLRLVANYRVTFNDADVTGTIDGMFSDAGDPPTNCDFRGSVMGRRQ
jgi:hypothetical protein